MESQLDNLLTPPAACDEDYESHQAGAEEGEEDIERVPDGPSHSLQLLHSFAYTVEKGGKVMSC